MPIVMRTYKNIPTDLGPMVAPVFICDVCGETIEKLSQGVFIHRLFEEQDRAVYIAHHNVTKRCHAAFERTHPLPGYEKWGWDHLGKLVYWLINNSGAEWEKLQGYGDDEQTKSLLARLGKHLRKAMESRKEQ